jgi:hypothetical protein
MYRVSFIPTTSSELGEDCSFNASSPLYSIGLLFLDYGSDVFQITHLFWHEITMRIFNRTCRCELTVKLVITYVWMNELPRKCCSDEAPKQPVRSQGVPLCKSFHSTPIHNVDIETLQ